MTNNKGETKKNFYVVWWILIIAIGVLVGIRLAG